VFEVDTRATSHVTSGRVRVNCSGGSTVAAKGTLTIDTRMTAGDTFLIGTKTFTVVANGVGADGEVARGADAAAGRVNIIAAINATDGVNTGSAVVAAEAGTGTVILTAKVPGTVGNSIVTTETFAAGTNVFDAATLGTTTAGVDPTAAEFTTAFVAAFPAGAGVKVKATRIAAGEVLVEAVDEGAFGYALAETLSGANNAWAETKMKNGLASGTTLKMARLSRVPNAVEVLADDMHFPIDFEPKHAQVLVYTTSTGAQVLWNGKITLQKTGPKYRVTVDNSGNVDWSVNETVSVLIFG
jgi:hypothetical protein